MIAQHNSECNRIKSLQYPTPWSAWKQIICLCDIFKLIWFYSRDQQSERRWFLTQNLGSLIWQWFDSIAIWVIWGNDPITKISVFNLCSDSYFDNDLSNQISFKISDKHIICIYAYLGVGLPCPNLEMRSRSH